MNILLLTPQPLYQERGTPIAVRMMLKVMSERGVHVDVVAYHEGTDFVLDNVTIYRIPKLPFIKNIPAGFSVKKLICDLFMIFKVLQLILQNRYQVIHAVEEAVFIALVVKLLFKIPYVYDMDSSLAQQIIEKFHYLSFLRPMLNYLEGLAVRHAKAVVPVCDALRDTAREYDPAKIVVLYDFPLVSEIDNEEVDDLRAMLNIEGLLMLYVGNLESYQGIDLLLESLALALRKIDNVDLVVVGGKPQDIEFYSQKASELNISNKVHFVGPRPVAHLAGYLSQADILVSPRIKGVNTPMKIYSYLDSSRAILATKMSTHTQVLDNNAALLMPPNKYAFARGILSLAQNQQLRQDLGYAGKYLIANKHNYSVFYKTLSELLDWLSVELDNPQNPSMTLDKSLGT